MRFLRDSIFINRRRLRDTIFITALFTVLMVTGIVIGLVVSAPQLSSMML